MRELGVVGGIVALIAGLTVAIMTGINHSDHVDCLRLHEQTGLQTRYARSGWTGECYVQVGAQWVPVSRWRVLDGAP